MTQKNCKNCQLGEGPQGEVSVGEVSVEGSASWETKLHPFNSFSALNDPKSYENIKKHHPVRYFKM